MNDADNSEDGTNFDAPLMERDSFRLSSLTQSVDFRSDVDEQTVDTFPDIMRYAMMMGLGVHYSYRPYNQCCLWYWNRFVQLSFFLGILFTFIMALFGIKIIEADTEQLVAQLFYFSGMGVQFVFIYLAVRAFKHETLTANIWFMKSMSYQDNYRIARHIGDIALFILLVGLLLVTILLYVAMDAYSSGIIGISILIVILLFCPSTFLLAGMFTFLFTEILHADEEIERLHARLIIQEVSSCEEYLSLRNTLISRWSNRQAMKWLTIGTLWNTLDGIVIMVSMATYLLNTPQFFQIFNIFLSLIFFGRHLALLAILFEYIGQANAKADQVLKNLVQQHWPEQETTRLALIVCIHQFPLGIEVGGFRLTLFQTRTTTWTLLVGFLIAFARSIIASSMHFY
jgi:hypothetical protein